MEKVKELSDLDEWEKRWEQRRKGNLKKIFRLAKKLCPIEYAKYACMDN
jgi:hypothetical protein